MSLLEDIIEHNRQDIATLATLLVRMATIYDAPVQQLTEQKDLFSAGKALENQGEFGPAKELYRVSAIPAPAGTVAALTGERISGMANWRLYHLLRRSGDVDGMKRVLEQMLTRRQRVFEVQVELSKLCEHRYKDFDRALRHAMEAAKICPEDQKEALQRRISRLEQKRIKSFGGI